MLFRCLLVLRNGEPADPAVLAARHPMCAPDDPFAALDGSRWRIVDIKPNESLARDFDALWTVKPLD